MDLPDTWQFLGGMWWVLHIIAIGLIFYIGYVVGKASASPDEEPGGWASDEEEREDSAAKETEKQSEEKW